tara:strand:- start:351 stop:455 length:105 start_codon:yes stop_codon:yes gene_type:complete
VATARVEAPVAAEELTTAAASVCCLWEQKNYQPA